MEIYPLTSDLELSFEILHQNYLSCLNLNFKFEIKLKP